MRTSELAAVVKREIERDLPPSQSHALPELIEQVSSDPYTFDSLQNYWRYPDDISMQEAAKFTCQNIVDHWDTRDPHGEPEPQKRAPLRLVR